MMQIPVMKKFSIAQAETRLVFRPQGNRWLKKFQRCVFDFAKRARILQESPYFEEISVSHLQLHSTSFVNLIHQEHYHLQHLGEKPTMLYLSNDAAARLFACPEFRMFSMPSQAFYHPAFAGLQVRVLPWMVGHLLA